MFRNNNSVPCQVPSTSFFLVRVISIFLESWTKITKKLNILFPSRQFMRESAPGKLGRTIVRDNAQSECTIVLLFHLLIMSSPCLAIHPDRHQLLFLNSCSIVRRAYPADTIKDSICSQAPIMRHYNWNEQRPSSWSVSKVYGRSESWLKQRWASAPHPQRHPNPPLHWNSIVTYCRMLLLHIPNYIYSNARAFIFILSFSSRLFQSCLVSYM